MQQARNVVARRKRARVGMGAPEVRNAVGYQYGDELVVQKIA